MPLNVIHSFILSLRFSFCLIISLSLSLSRFLCISFCLFPSFSFSVFNIFYSLSLFLSLSESYYHTVIFTSHILITNYPVPVCLTSSFVQIRVPAILATTEPRVLSVKITMNAFAPMDSTEYNASSVSNFTCHIHCSITPTKGYRTFCGNCWLYNYQKATINSY